MKTIVVTGGGSGGHITPILAVAAELKKLDADIRIVYIGQKGDGLSDVPAADPNIAAVYSVRAGKLRRYHGEGWHQLLDLPTQYKNIRDAVWVLVGTWQSYKIMGQLKPQLIFSRGGFVSVPVALGGHLRGVPYITHDSDSTPSLANRLIARWARLHAVALPAETYPYPLKKTVTVGVPVSHQYQPVTKRLMRHYRQLLHLEGYEQVITVGGSGNGARTLNEQMVANAAYLLKRYPKMAILHISGREWQNVTRQAYDEALAPEERNRVVVEGFVTDFYRYSGAADVVIARGGATNLAEFAVQGKACVIIPAAMLVGGHQVKNAEAFAKRDAIVLMTEEQADQERRLASVLIELIEDGKRRQELSQNLAALAHSGSAHELAQLLLQQIVKQNPKN